MIQRIQSVYLLIVAILSVIVISSSLGSFIGADNSITEFTNLSLVAQDGTEDYRPWALFAIQMISAIISLITIFLYKKRMLQIRLTLFNIILTIGYYVAFVTFIFMLKGDATFVPSWIVCLPFIAIVLDWLAIRAIGKDEMLVKAYERLR
ncbi:DUF4293 domain-containing protein [Bacteroides caecigallinarum]|uniref:DUF4293 domain-containing protein n=1 Tax=Bacteroides caecigallinarum TaxID=1411144 RepID=UPI00195C4BBC|nr:DUF4293 domain-containing protein [Bacteroides caecigallinarum]MBM6881703.1 DUF4293 domain-containing protein [Bacteroides caecigallinarum]MBM6889946.1 DUF4293 domain-containing protein [Bacteroides caecigallinarum]MCF2552844.1 DUF4293 domain-containing protein [Bacteroides caecigallinarum]